MKILYILAIGDDGEPRNPAGVESALISPIHSMQDKAYPVAQMITSTSCSTLSTLMKPLGVILSMPWENVVTLGRISASRKPLPGCETVSVHAIFYNEQPYRWASAANTETLGDQFLDEIFVTSKSRDHLVGRKLVPPLAVV